LHHRPLGRGSQTKLAPPSTWMVWPFTYAASSENRNATIAAMSSGIPRRGEATDVRISVRHSSVVLASAALVRITPAATELHRTPCLPPSVAVWRASLHSPQLAA